MFLFFGLDLRRYMVLLIYKYFLDIDDVNCPGRRRYNMNNRHFLMSLVVSLCIISSGFAAEPVFLQRSLSEVQEKADDLSTATAHYKPMFGIGDDNSAIVKGVARFGELTVEPGGSSKFVSYKSEEQIYYILDGTGLLHYGQEKVPVSKNDFMYIPVGIENGISNPREKPLRLIVMGFKIPEGTQVQPIPKLMLANADDVELQVLGQHGPTTQFKLLMGTTRSRRDRLAAANQVNSLFLMDFAPGGTNIPHSHPREEEIYYILKGHGDMVAGTDSNGQEMRYPAKQGDAFFFAPKTLIGFYSGTKEGQEHAQILAVRSRYPSSGRQR